MIVKAELVDEYGGTWTALCDTKVGDMSLTFDETYDQRYVWFDKHATRRLFDLMYTGVTINEAETNHAN